MRWYDMKGQPNRDSNPVPPSQGSNHSTNWANEAGYIDWGHHIENFIKNYAAHGYDGHIGWT